MKQMRINYTRDLNTKETKKVLSKKKLEKYNKTGQNQDMDLGFADITFFEETDGIDKEIMKILQKKLETVKDRFGEWQLKQIENNEAIIKKLKVYENMSVDQYGLVDMPLEDIITGLKSLDMTADELWDKIILVFGNEYFLPTIERLYGALFVNDTKKHGEQIQQAINRTISNELALLESCEK